MTFNKGKFCLSICHQNDMLNESRSESKLRVCEILIVKYKTQNVADGNT